MASVIFLHAPWWINGSMKLSKSSGGVTLTLLSSCFISAKNHVGAVLRDVDPRAGQALLAHVLERLADDVLDGVADVSTIMNQVEVLARGVGHEAREVAVLL